MDRFDKMNKISEPMRLRIMSKAVHAPAMNTAGDRLACSTGPSGPAL